MIHGYHGQYISIDLTGKSSRTIALSSETCKRWIGGVGLGTEILLSETPAGYDPLGDEAALVFSFSPLVGTPLTTSAKFAVIAKSPLTNRLCDAMCSSGFAISGKKIGVDAICLKGIVQDWSILFISHDSDGKIQYEIQPANDLLGQSARITEQTIKSRYGAHWQVMSIGKAGEMLVPFATMSHDGRHAGRGGLGAVLGSKKIKAIAVSGTQRVEIHDAHQTIQLAKALSEKSFGPATIKYREMGTIGNLLVFNRFNALPTRNFQSGQFENAEMLASHDLAPAQKIAKNSCKSCTIGCEHIYALGNSTKSGVRMEYESLFALGPLCGISDSEAVLKSADLCDEYGIDTISTGGTIAFLMDCVNRQLIDGRLGDDDEDLLQFGNAQAMHKLIEMMMSVSNNHLVQLARLGSRRAALAIGQNSIAFAPQVKGMEMPGYHPASLHAMALGLAIGTRGADHNRSGAYEVDFRNQKNDPDSIASAVIETENRAAIMDSVILCKFIRGVFTDYYAEIAELLNAVTGFQYTLDDLEATGSRIVNLRKWFNQREGWTSQEDILPDSMFSAEIEGRPALTRGKLNAMIASYYRLRHWDEKGNQICRESGSTVDL